MARELKPGDLVTLKKTFRLKQDSPAYQQGLKSVKAGDIGEVVGNAEGRSVMVSFKGIEVPVTKQRLERADEPAPKRRGRRAGAAQEPAAETPQAAPPAQEAPAPKRRGRKPGSGRKPETATLAAAGTESGQLLTLIANKLLLRGSVKVEQGTAVEVSLSDLPEEVQKQIQALINAKLSLNLNNLSK